MIRSRFIYFNIISQTFRLTKMQLLPSWYQRENTYFPEWALNAEIFNHIKDITHIYSQLCK